MNNPRVPYNRSLIVLETSPKEIRSEKYEQLSKLIYNIGEWNVNLSALTKQWKIPVSTLHRWKDKIVAERGPIEISKVGSQIQQNMISM